ncbi:holo-ACP synthase [Caldanaerobacter sp.]|uniref:holo-ACP synthase n=1 Tax=Caldanaerobacter sp. TaxID=2930036 RepID=UPI003C71009C
MGIFVGSDIVSVERLKKTANRRKGFFEKIFTEKEKIFLEKKRNPWTHMAGLFSAKESVAKLLGTGIRGFSWRDIEIIHDEYGKPEVHLSGKARMIALKKGIKEIKLSISHTSEYAISVAVAVGGDDFDCTHSRGNERS